MRPHEPADAISVPTLKSIPNQVPVSLKLKRIVSGAGKQFIGEHGIFKIGIAWQAKIGSTAPRFEGTAGDGRFHWPSSFRLAVCRGVRLISLQKTSWPGAVDQPAQWRDRGNLGRDDFDGGPDAFIDTAAVVMSNLDLIITPEHVDCPFGGFALGRPNWVALRYVPDWRWLLDRDDSPWYPTTRLFRQDADGDWKSANFENRAKTYARRFGCKSH